MQAVILCAGKGVRMGELTRDLPKPLLRIGEKTLLEYKLNNLPKEIHEIILIIGYKGEKIKEAFGDTFYGIPIRYVEDLTITGTAHALWHAKAVLQGRFVVMMGDDIYSTKAIQGCARHDFSIACKKGTREEPGSRIVMADNNLTDFVTHKKYQTTRDDGGLIFTGLYSLTTDIFNYQPVKLETKEEWGLPQTLLKAAKDHPVVIVETDFWISINDPDDLGKVNSILECFKI